MPVKRKRDDENDAQELIQKFVNQDQVWALGVFGAGGTGKSESIKMLASENGHKAVVLAPTGIAAENIGGKTIASFCQVRKFERGMKFEVPVSEKLAKRKIPIELVIIDEISMVSILMIRYLEKVLRHLNGEPNLLFGGAKLIMFGDQYQLPAIEGKPAYCSKLFKRHSFKVLHLTKIHRQLDPKFQSALLAIRLGDKEDLKRALKYINDNCYQPNFHDDESIIICPTNVRVDIWNQKKLKKLSKTGEKTYNKDGNELKLRVGTRVMATENNSSHGYYNGSLGVVVNCEKNGPTVNFDAINEPVKVKNSYWERRSSPGQAIPLKLAFAITVHKAQGQTFKKVIINLTDDFFAKGQLYVALSRVREIQGLKISRKLTKNDVIPNKTYARILSQFEEWK